jgi:chemotaxis protein CheX
LKIDDAQPISPDVRSQVLEPFIEAVCVTLREMASTEVILQDSFQTTIPRTLGDISAIIALSFEAGGTGSLVLGCSEATAGGLARRVLAESGQEPDETMVRDCLGEIANVVAGQAKVVLFGTRWHFLLSTPTVVSGVGKELPECRGGQCLVAVFGSDVGEVVVEVYLQD